MELLAQLTDTQFSPAQLVTWLAIAGAIGGGFLALQRFRKGLAEELKRELQAAGKAAAVEVSNRPLDVREWQEMTPLSMHKDLADQVKDLREAMQKQFTESAIAASKGRKELHEKIEAQGLQLAGLVAKQEMVSQRVVQMDGKLDKVLLSLAPNQGD